MKTAVLIPAHNEATLIGETVRNSLKVVAPDSPIFVVADRCYDDTADQARAAGARTYERHDGPPGKGAAIAWFVDAAAGDLSKVEAVVIIDADARLRLGSVEALARALYHGAAAAQGFVLPVPEEASPAVWLAAYSEWLSQAIRDRLRHRLGWPVPLRGTGMAFRPSVLGEIAPLLRTRVEDVEMTLLLVAWGHPIAFVPEAVVEDPKPRGVEHLARQRARWLQGQREIWRSYRPIIFRLVRTARPDLWWLLSSLLLKPRALVIAAKVGALLGFGLLWLLFPFRFILFSLVLVALSFLLDGFYYFSGLFFLPPSWHRPMARALLRAPFYVAMWTRALVWSLTARGTWLRARD